MTLRVLSLFSGVGGIELGLERAGFETVAFAETDRFCSRVFAARWPGVPNLGDVRNLGADGDRGGGPEDERRERGRAGREPRRDDVHTRPGIKARHLRGNAPLASASRLEQLGRIDLLSGGFPCQDLSVAGKRAGLGGARSSLFFEFARVAAELRPRWLLVENVPGLLSSHRSADFAVVVRTLDELGYGLAWRVLDSRHFGVPQRRRRLFLVGHIGAECPTEVLFEPEGGGGHPAAGGAAGEDVAYALAASARGTGDQYGNAWNTTYALTGGGAAYIRGNSGSPERGDMTIVAATPTGEGPLSSTLRTHYGKDWNDPTNLSGPLIVHTLRASGFDASEDGTGRGTPLVAAPLTHGSFEKSHTPGRRREDDENLVATWDERNITSPDNRTTLRPDEAQTLHADGLSLLAPSTVRRLTPTECERLQGFPDGWSCLEVDFGPDGVARFRDGEPYSTACCRCPDGPRYAALGNAVTVNVARWIGARILAAEAAV